MTSRSQFGQTGGGGDSIPGDKEGLGKEETDYKLYFFKMSVKNQ